MPKYIIEREFPPTMTEEQLVKAAKASVKVLKEMKSQLQWVQSYVTEEKTYSVYIAPSPKEFYDHAKKAGLPCNKVSRVKVVIDPSTAEPG
jgi:Nickel responsive protein SCO4226-like